MLNILKLLVGSGKGASVGTVAKDLREAIKGKEIDPQKAIDLMQQLNSVEAGHRSIFVAGWRPYIGWICGTAFGMYFIVFPLIATYTELAVPDLDIEQVVSVLMGMLGMGGLRTLEKIKKVTR